MKRKYLIKDIKHLKYFKYYVIHSSCVPNGYRPNYEFDTSLYWDLVFQNIGTLETLVIDLMNKRSGSYRLNLNDFEHWYKNPEDGYFSYFSRPVGLVLPRNLIPMEAER